MESASGDGAFGSAGSHHVKSASTARSARRATPRCRDLPCCRCWRRRCRRADNWATSCRRARSTSHVTLRELPRAGERIVRASGRHAEDQPEGRAARTSPSIGSGVDAGRDRGSIFRIVEVHARHGVDHADLPSTEQFAPAQFFDMSDADKLSRRSFEPLRRGRAHRRRHRAADRITRGARSAVRAELPATSDHPVQRGLQAGCTGSSAACRARRVSARNRRLSHRAAGAPSALAAGGGRLRAPNSSPSSARRT